LLKLILVDQVQRMERAFNPEIHQLSHLANWILPDSCLTQSEETGEWEVAISDNSFDSVQYSDELQKLIGEKTGNFNFLHFIKKCFYFLFSQSPNWLLLHNMM